MAGMSVEIMGKAEVQQTKEGSSSLQLLGMAAVESQDGSSLELVGKAAVQRDGGSLEIIGKASVQDPTGNIAGERMVHFSWTSACLKWAVLSSVCLILLVRFIYLWQQCLLTSGASSWSVVKASVVLGTEVGLFAMAVLLVLMVPRMIVTWTTAVVFKYILSLFVSGKSSSRHEIVREGNKIAKEISWITLTSVVGEGNVVAASVLIVCFTTTAVFRQVLAIG
ncbi:unnamed protein product [Calypogeia fissa]